MKDCVVPVPYVNANKDRNQGINTTRTLSNEVLRQQNLLFSKHERKHRDHESIFKSVEDIDINIITITIISALDLQNLYIYIGTVILKCLLILQPDLPTNNFIIKKIIEYFEKNEIKKNIDHSCEINSPMITVRVSKPVDSENSKLSLPKNMSSLKSLNTKLIENERMHKSNYESPDEILLNLNKLEEIKSPANISQGKKRNKKNHEEISSMSSNSIKLKLNNDDVQNNLLNAKKEHNLKSIGKNKSRQYISNCNVNEFILNDDLNKNDGSIIRSCSQSKLSPFIQLSIEDSKSNMELEVAQKMKNILFCSISHELRNPINHINGILECIGSYMSPNDHIQQFVNIALSSTNLLMYKIDDIMDYSLLETNTLKLRLEEYSIRDMLSSIQDILCLQFDSSLLNFSIYISDNVPDKIYFDHRRVKQVLINLVFNALKYTEKGYVTVIVDSEQKKQREFKSKEKYNNLALNFAVSDSGCGIEKK